MNCFGEKNVKCCLLNAHSVKNKALLLSDFLIDLNIDLFAITELGSVEMEI